MAEETPQERMARLKAEMAAVKNEMLQEKLARLEAEMAAVKGEMPATSEISTDAETDLIQSPIDVLPPVKKSKPAPKAKTKPKKKSLKPAAVAPVEEISSESSVKNGKPSPKAATSPAVIGKKPAKGPSLKSPNAKRGSSTPQSKKAETKGKSQKQKPSPKSEHDIEDTDVRAPGIMAAISRFARRWNFSAFSLSAIAHCVLLIVLAFMTIVIPSEEENLIGILANTTETEDVEIVEIEELEIVELEEIEETEVTMGELDAADLELASGAIDTDLAVVESGTMDIQGVGELGERLFGKELGEGGKVGVTSFFGIASKGQKFMYLIDNSLSMKNGKFDQAAKEMINSIDNLSPKQQYYCVFFSDKPYPLYFPKTAEKMVYATDEEKAKTKEWVETVELVLKTKCLDSIKGAIAMQPDAIYLLTDGVFTDGTLDYLKSIQGQNKIPIHTIGFASKKGEDTLKQIADMHNGTYRFVPLDKKKKPEPKPEPEETTPETDEADETKPEDGEENKEAAEKKLTPAEASAALKKLRMKNKKAIDAGKMTQAESQKIIKAFKEKNGL